MKEWFGIYYLHYTNTQKHEYLIAIDFINKVSQNVRSLLLIGVFLSINRLIIEIYTKTQSFHTETMQKHASSLYKTSVNLFAGTCSISSPQ